MTERLTQKPGVKDRYLALVAAGEIARDDAQIAIAERLDALIENLSEESVATKKSALGWLFGRGRDKARPAEPAIRGLYVWGEVGRGKTMLMDMFFAALPTSSKRRIHFHGFMQDVHERIYRVRAAIADGSMKGDDPVPPVAAELAGQARVLCFDEFAVTDIADAMILGRLFTELFARGVILVATSNVDPADLYRDGINRGHFLGFIALLRRHVDVLRLDAQGDYRLEKLAGQPLYFTPLDARAEHALDRLFLGLTGQARGRPEQLNVDGRRVPVPEAVGGVARFHFRDLCEAALGPHDYLAIARRFHTVVLSGVPVLTPDTRNEAKRFITLIDALYDGHVRLLVSAAAEPDALFRGRDSTEAFEFQRTASRLIEMRSAVYVAACEAETETELSPASAAGQRH